MKQTIETPKGKYIYTLKIVYEGVKKINREIARDNLLHFNAIAKRNSLKYGLLFGTFLGAMREHDIIEHDEDLDLFILYENKSIFLSMLFELREAGFEVIRYDRRGDMCSLMRNGEYMDISFFKHYCDKVRVALSYFLPEKFLLNLAQYDFLGSTFWGPKDWKEYLIFWYGESWNVPIQRDKYDLPYWKVLLQKIKWIVFFKMPSFLFDPIMTIRRREKIKLYNYRVDRYNTIYGSHVFDNINR